MENTICLFFSFLVEAVILYQYASALFMPKRRTGIRLTVLGVLYLTLFILSMFASIWLNTFMYLLVNFIFFISQYRLKWHSALFHSVMLTAVMGICELAVYGVIQYSAPHFYQKAVDFHSMLIFVIFSKMIFFTIVYICIHFFKGRQELERSHDHSVLLLVFIPLTSVFVMLTFVTINNAYVLSSALIVIITLDSVFLLITNLLVFGINQYNQKRMSNSQKCSYCFKRSELSRILSDVIISE